jgi:hypothetical protein
MDQPSIAKADYGVDQRELIGMAEREFCTRPPLQKKSVISLTIFV